jgi:hypothetical protein
MVTYFYRPRLQNRNDGYFITKFVAYSFKIYTFYSERFWMCCEFYDVQDASISVQLHYLS